MMRSSRQIITFHVCLLLLFFADTDYACVWQTKAVEKIWTAQARCGTQYNRSRSLGRRRETWIDKLLSVLWVSETTCTGNSTWYSFWHSVFSLLRHAVFVVPTFLFGCCILLFHFMTPMTVVYHRRHHCWAVSIALEEASYTERKFVDVSLADRDDDRNGNRKCRTRTLCLDVAMDVFWMCRGCGFISSQPTAQYERWSNSVPNEPTN